MVDDSGEAEATRRGSEPAPESLLPLEIAMNAEHDDPSGHSPARELLRKQARLVDQQIALARNERFRNRIKAARDAALAGLALAVVAGAGWAVWDASRAEGVVIEPFAVAPALAQQGLTGSVVANRLLGTMAEMQAGTESTRAGRATRSGGDELSMEIPETGVSSSEVMRLLRRRFGHETIVTGELGVDKAGAPTLRVYADGRPLKLPAPPPPPGAAVGLVATSPVDALLDRGAEAVFERTDAYRYSTWLRFQEDRKPEGRQILRRLSTRGPPEERAWALVGLSSDAREDGLLDQSIFLAEEAARLNPELPNPHGSLASTASLKGHRERQLREERRKLALIARQEDGKAAARAESWLASAIVNDEQGALEALELALAAAPSPGRADALLSAKAAVQAALHDVTAARRTLASLNTPLQPGSDTAKDAAWWVGGAVQDWAGIEAELRAPPTSPEDPTLRFRTTTRVQPRLAHVVARQGRHAEAAALIAATPLDCFWCVLNRGWVAALGGDAKGADRWFAEAVRQGPSLPEAYSEWGEARLLRGDLDGAIQLFREAEKRAPRWADPLKFEGDALARRGDHRGAARKYGEAAERAPRWGALHLAWGRSLESFGRGEEAWARYGQAARLDLSSADRAAVRVLLARRAG